MPVVHHGSPGARVDAGLRLASHIFIRVDAVKRPLVPPYEGPFPVLERSDKTFVVLKRDKPVTVTIDRLKPAVLLPESPLESGIDPVAPMTGLRPRPRPPAGPPAPSRPLPSPAPLETRSGRLSRPPSRFQL